MRTRARAYTGARANVQTHVPARARLHMQLGTHPNSTNIRNVSASSFGIAAPRPHERRTHRRGVPRQHFLVRPKLIFLKKMVQFLGKKMGPFFFQKTAAGIPKTADAALQHCALCALEDGCYRTANVAEQPRHIGRIWCYRNRCPTRCASTPSLAKAHARSLTRAEVQSFAQPTWLAT